MGAREEEDVEVVGMWEGVVEDGVRSCRCMYVHCVLRKVDLCRMCGVSFSFWFFEAEVRLRFLVLGCVGCGEDEASGIGVSAAGVLLWGCAGVAVVVVVGTEGASVAGMGTILKVWRSGYRMRDVRLCCGARDVKTGVM